MSSEPKWPDDYLIPGVEPYFQEEAGIIYCGDCQDILPYLPKVDLVLTDPPYINLIGGAKKRKQLKGLSVRKNETVTVGDIWNANLEWANVVSEKLIFGGLIFCSFKSLIETRLAFSQLQLMGIVTWYKRNSLPSFGNTPQYTTEFILALKKNSGLDWGKLEIFLNIPGLPSGCMATERILNSSGLTAHPTQKPLLLTKKLLAIGGNVILDPFLGSGTTAISAKALGRRYIGIEIEEKYCELAARRLGAWIPEPEESRKGLFF